MEIFGIIIPASIFGAISGLFGSWLRAAVMRKRLFQGEAVLLAQLRNDWVALRPDWHKSLLIALGPEGHYSPASPLEKERFTDFLNLISRTVAQEKNYTDDNLQKRRTSIRNSSHEYEQAARNVGMFLASLANLVLTGRLTASQAYSVVGPDLTIRSKQIRIVLGNLEPSWASPQVSNELRRLSSWAASLPGTTERILSLVDILWAESCRLGDAQEWYFVRASSVKNERSTGVACRRRVSVHAFRSKGFMVALSLSRHLLWAEFIPLRYKKGAPENMFLQAQYMGGFKMFFVMNYIWLRDVIRVYRSEDK